MCKQSYDENSEGQMNVNVKLCGPFHNSQPFFRVQSLRTLNNGVDLWNGLYQNESSQIFRFFWRLLLWLSWPVANYGKLVLEKKSEINIYKFSLGCLFVKVIEYVIFRESLRYSKRFHNFTLTCLCQKTIISFSIFY